MGIAVFAILAASILSLSAGNGRADVQSTHYVQATSLAEEGLEAVRSIRDRAYNEFTYSTSSVSVSGAQWIFDGENTTETIGDYVRTITFEDVCRDGSSDIVTCPGTYTDEHLKLASVLVEWQPRPGVTSTVERVAYVSNWDSSDWTQTDWVGGAGQSLWSDATKYDSDDSNVNVSVAGEVTLASAGGGCGTNIWEFTTPGQYSYDSGKIEVTGGNAQLKGSAPALSGIADAVLSSFEFDTVDGHEPDIIHVSGDIYAIAYRGDNGDGWLATVDIDSAGTITASVIDTLEFDATDADTPDIFHVSGDVYGIAYNGPGVDGWLVTMTIDSSGNIGASVIDSLEYDTSNGETPNVIAIAGDIYAIVYQGPAGDGWLATVDIDSAGNIANSVVDSFEYDTDSGQGPDIVHISGDVYAIAYNGSGGDGWLATVSINASGAITASTIDTFEFDTNDANRPELQHVSGDVYAIAYDGPGADGWLVTVTIDTSGNITNSLIDSLEFDTSSGITPSILYATGTAYLVAYNGPGSDGFVQLIDIQTDGNIAASAIDILEFDTSDGTNPTMVEIVAGDIYAISYEGVAGDGFVITIDLETASTYPSDTPSINPTASFSVPAIDTWSAFAETASKDGGEIYYQLSEDAGSTWQYWTGAAWASAVGATDYNISSVINTNIQTFSTSTGAIMFKAFLESDSAQFVQLDNVTISCEQSYDWTFSNSGDYQFDSAKIEVTGGYAQLKAGAASLSGIADAVIDSFEFDTSNGAETHMIHVSGDIYAIAYQGPGSDGWLATVDIDIAGTIVASVIDTLEFDTSQGGEPYIFHVSGDVYGIAYAGPGTDGWLATMTIDSSGNIGNSVVDSLEYDTGNGDVPSVVHVSGDVYAIAYQGPGTDGWLATVTIDSSGNIGAGTVDTLEWDNNNGREPSMVHVSGDYYAIAYRGPGNDGWVATVTIDSSGNIGAGTVDSFEFDPSDGFRPDLEHVSGDYYAVAYQGANGDGWLATMTIDSSGNIGGSTVDTFEFDTNDASYPDLLYATGDYYFIAYSGVAGDGFITMIDIATNGQIGAAVLDTLEFDTADAYYPSIVELAAADTYAIAYQSTGSDGFVTTIELESSSSYPTDVPPVTASTSLSLASPEQWTGFTETAIKNGGEVYYQLSDDEGATWQYWNGSSWAAAGASNYNTAAIVDTNIGDFSTSSGKIVLKSFLQSDGTQFVRLDNVRVDYGESGGGGGYALSGWVIGSAFDMSDASPVQLVEWDQSIPACTPTCEAKIQLRTAPDSGGSPGAWTAWYGESGAATYFTDNTGSLVSTSLNGNRWAQYRLELIGDGTNTPTFSEIRVNYR